MYWNQLFRPPPRNFSQFSRGGPKPPFCGAGRASLIQYMGGWQGLRQDCQEGQRRGGGKELDEFLRCLSCLDIPLSEKFSSTRYLLVFVFIYHCLEKSIWTSDISKTIFQVWDFRILPLSCNTFHCPPHQGVSLQNRVEMVHLVQRVFIIHLENLLTGSTFAIYWDTFLNFVLLSCKITHFPFFCVWLRSWLT